MDKLIKQLVSPLADAAFEWLRQPENMKDVWDWCDAKANESSTIWDDTAVFAVKTVWPHVLDIAEDYMADWIKS